MRSSHQNSVARGAAMAAGLADGLNIFSMQQLTAQYPQCETYLPTTTTTDRDARYHKWKMAIERSLGWSVQKKSEAMTDQRYRLLASVPAAMFVLGSFVMLAVSKRL